MTRFLLAVSLSALGAVRLPAQIPGDPLQLVPPQAGFVAGAQLSRLLASPMAAQFQQQIKEAGPNNALAGAFRALLQGLDRVVVTSSSRDLLKPGAALGGKTQPPMLIILQGRFDPSQVRGLLNNKVAPELYRNVEMFQAGDAKQKQSAAMLGPGLLLFGDRKELTGAIDRWQGAAPRRPVSPRVAQLAAANDVWFTAEVPPDALMTPKPGEPAAANTPAAQMMKNVTGLDFGMSLRDGLGLDVELRTRSAETAQSLAQALQGLLALGAMNAADAPEVGRMMQKLRIAPAGTGVKVALSLTQAEVEQLAKTMQSQAERASKAPAGPGVGSAPVAAPKEPEGPKTIRITGLEQGPVEIPLEPAKKK